MRALKAQIPQLDPLAFLNSLGHTTGFSTSKAFNKEKMIQDWISWNCPWIAWCWYTSTTLSMGSSFAPPFSEDGNP